MKNLLQFLLVSICVLGSCTEPIDRSDAIPRDEPIEIAIDFRFQENYSSPGYVQFINDSKGLVSYYWDFGYENEKGERVTSKETNPYIFFPENREYVVTLVGIDFRGEEHRVRHWIPVVFRCC